MNETASMIDFYRALEVAGVWAAAIATFFTALTAIRIAKRQDEIRLKASVVDAMTISDAAADDVVWISITNVARRTATVSAVSWRLSNRFKNKFYQKVDPPNPQLPYPLRDGENLTIVIPVNTEWGNWYERFSKVFDRFSYLRRRYEMMCLRVEVYCSTGEMFEAKPSRGFLKRLREASERRS